MKNISRNWVAAILIGGLAILPSLYAWFNIGASWDPYGQTEQIPVGVVNEDEGATVRGEDINVGDDLVDTLHDSDDMDWRFVDREKAMDKVEYGDYFSVIIIPEDFSEHLGSVVSDEPEKAAVEYYVNEKINAIAPKITEKGASVIVDQISSNFISTVNGVIFDMFNDIGLEIEQDLPDIKNFEDYIFTIEENLPEIKDTLDETATDANNAQDIIDRAQALIPDVKETTNQGLETIDETTAFLKKGEDRLNEIAPEIEADLETVQETSDEIDEFIQDIDTSNIDFSGGKQVIDDAGERVQDAIATIGAIEEALGHFKEQQSPDKRPDNEGSPDNGENPGGEDTPGQERAPEDDEKNSHADETGGTPGNGNDDEITRAMEKLASLKETLTVIQEKLQDARGFLDEKEGEADDVITHLQDISSDMTGQIDGFVKEYKETIEPKVFAEIDKAKDTLSDARSILTDIQSTIPEVENMLDRTEGNLNEGKSTLDDVLDEYPYINDKVSELADRIREVQSETDINEIIGLLKNDPDAESGFFAEPVELHENKLFPIENYGTGMTPFYTVLAIWVGALLLISLVAVDVKEREAFSEREVYFGRFFTFMVIGLVQTAIVTLGDMFLVGVTVQSGVWFVLFGLIISIVFMLIVYSLVSVFGDVGKALAIIFLVLQIAGAGGTYPVVLLPEFFQWINPFLPFTYAVDLLREAVGGIVWERALKDIGYLALFGLAAIIFGAFLKKPINKHTDKLAEKSRESGLFH